MRAGAPARGRASSGASRCSREVEPVRHLAHLLVALGRRLHGGEHGRKLRHEPGPCPPPSSYRRPRARSSTWNSKIGIASPALVLKLSGPASARRSHGSLSSGSRTTLRSTPRPAAALCARSIASWPERSASKASTTSRARRASSPTCSSVSAVPIEATAFRKPGLVQGEHVRVALHHDHAALPCVACGRAQVEAEQRAALAVDRALGGVDVLRLLVVAHRARAEAEHPPAGVAQREHDPRPEAVVDAALPAPLGEPGGLQLLLGEARPAARSSAPGPRRSARSRRRTPRAPRGRGRGPRGRRARRAASSESHR